MAQHELSIEAFCADLLAGDYHAPRMKAVWEISHQINEQASKGRAEGINNLRSTDQ